ncbi:sulfite exporter TauE/SafE family protein [Mumia zhuanghuii]|uniref:sulfite exporter TauE/SafE family protein n=1 Tax=Mumia zhuanghuii TaxID=2585211 RepID=UPI003642CE1F
MPSRPVRAADVSEELLLGLALLGILVGALAQAATGMGFSLVAAPFMVTALGPREGVAATVLLAVFASTVPLVRDRREVQPGAVTRMLLPTLVCTPLIAWAVRDVETRWLGLAGGVGVVIAVALLASGLRSRWLGTPQAAVLTGATSAALNVVGGVGGPPIGLYAANAGWEPQVMRANLTAFFLVQNLATALVLGVHLPGAPQLAVLGVGTAAGMLLASRLTPSRVRTGILALSLLGGLGLVGGAL